MILMFPSIDFGAFTSDDPENMATTLQLVALMTVLSLAPAILILMTSFTRIVIVLSFVRMGLATQQMPPNQVLISLALFMTFFIMAPVFSDINESALTPMLDGEMTQEEAFTEGTEPLKEFMSQHTREKDLALFMGYAGLERPETLEDVPLTALIPAFAISELKTAFQIGFLIFVPFLVIDMIVASILMSMGMMMLPPVMISLPFKILLFVLVDGWYLIVESLLLSY
ncbi:flagellar biosynthetic protein FliP [Sinobaca qinghaiensis]|uniref:Flagellar biosynthetic protein FliP n=1 Tax=Sinobaca qinghaiensis TaxID=342944 RepID=A0A419V5X5_9BACL|nr:flagellar type III secretion system pore protein FliP [Sinobaca qinghaiensis]RKD75359.1 flagellar biosynthetic protein FliP [Sinobaca qinghaiensis]